MPNNRKHPGFIPKEPHQHKPLDFPEHFLWGAATSAHQIEGWNDKNDWWEWEHKSGTIADGQLSGRGPDHYHLYKKDHDLLEALSLGAYRLSIEWSRIEPTPGKFNEEAIQHYHDVLADLKRRGIKVMLTLHHFTIPQWFARKGGFEKRRNVADFVRYAERCFDEYRDLVDFWITINEPNIYSMMSYLLGIWPPGKISYWSCYNVFANLAAAHKEVYKYMHAQKADVQVGVAMNVTSFYNYNNRSLFGWLSVNVMDWVWNHWFLEKTAGTHDYLGMNYYVHKRVKGISSRNLGALMRDNQGEGRERTDLDWEIFAPGFFDALVNYSQYKLPIYVTENGISTLNDHERARYIVSYVKELYHAVKTGVDVRGYFYWSLMDNFEWDKGYKSRFGLVKVDYRTLEREIRASARLYGRIAERNGIEHDLLRFVGHGVDPEAFLKERQSEEGEPEEYAFPRSRQNGRTRRKTNRRQD